MLTYFPAFSSSLLLFLTVNLLGFSKPANLALNYCTPVVAKENISFEKLQIGSWVATQSNAIAPLATFGSATPNYDFSLKGMPLTRDTFYWQIWVDLNGDLDYDDLGENLLKVATTRKQKAIGKLILPKIQTDTLMVRVLLSKAKANNPCGTIAKVMDFYDFSIYENCSEVNTDQQVKIGEILENQTTFSFYLASNVLLSWQLKKLGEDWTAETTLIGNSLTLKDLLSSSSYAFRYRLQCKDSSWTAWSDSIVFKTKDVPNVPCSAPSLDSVAIVFANYYSINLTYQGKAHQKVVWNYPYYYQNCSLKSDTTKRVLDVWYKNGERISVRLKGVCKSGQVSPFSDTLWFERPCIAIDTFQFWIGSVTDQTARVTIGIGDFCSYAHSVYITTDTTLHDSLWRQLPSNSEGKIEIKNLMPDTRYFIKIKGNCYNAENTIYFSGIKTFKTRPKLTECAIIDSSDISLHPTISYYGWLRVNTAKVSSIKEFIIEDATYHQISTGQFNDSIPISFASGYYSDTKYQIRLKNKCGDIESDWSAPIPLKPFLLCPKINPQRLSHTFENNIYRLTYTVNPEAPIPGPFLWRYREWGDTWDTLTTDTNFIEFPGQLIEKYATLSVLPSASTGCNDSYWTDYVLNAFSCSPLQGNAFELKSFNSNSATFYIHRDKGPTFVRVFYQKTDVNESSNPFIEVPPTATEITINNLQPNSEYLFRLCDYCPSRTHFYFCTRPINLTTPKSNSQPNPELSLAKPFLLTSMKLVPNPSNGLFQVELPSGLEGTATLSITNLSGQLIQRTPLQLFLGVNPQIDLSQQTQGVYFIHLQLGKQVYQEKLVLIH